MCTGIEVGLIAAAATAAGTATDAYAQNQQLSKQNDIAAAGIIKQGELQKQGESDVSSLTNSVANSNAATQAKTAQQLKSYTTALGQSNLISNSAEPNVPGASKAYADEQKVAGGDAKNYVNAIAQSAATTQGTQLERVDEGQQEAATAGKLGVLSGTSNEQNYLTKLQIQATQQNPWLTSLGTLLKGVGAGLSIYSGAAGLAGGAADLGADVDNTTAALGSNSSIASATAASNPFTGGTGAMISSQGPFTGATSIYGAGNDGSNGISGVFQ